MNPLFKRFSITKYNAYGRWERNGYCRKLGLWEKIKG